MADQEKQKLTPERLSTLQGFLGVDDAGKPFWTNEELLHVWDIMPDKIRFIDFKGLLYYCKAHKLNPVLEDIQCEYKSKGEGKGFAFVKTVKIDTYRRRAAEDGVIDSTWEEFGKDDPRYGWTWKDCWNDAVALLGSEKAVKDYIEVKTKQAEEEAPAAANVTRPFA